MVFLTSDLYGEAWLFCCDDLTVDVESEDLSGACAADVRTALAHGLWLVSSAVFVTTGGLLPT